MTPAPRRSLLKFGCTVASRLTETDRLCRNLRSWLKEAGLARRSFAVELLARESLNNAVIHVNRSFADKTISVELLVGRKWIRLKVADEGPGFDWRTARRKCCRLESDSGRGLTICALYAEQVRFNRRGNQITLWLRRDRK
jgi:anti-sigma regulatory factor (Ser/Thr protein kinase)